MSAKSIVKISKVESLNEHLQEMENRIRIAHTKGLSSVEVIPAKRWTTGVRPLPN